VEDSYEHNNEHSGSIKGGKYAYKSSGTPLAASSHVVSITYSKW